MEFNYRQTNDAPVSVFELLYDMADIMLTKSNKLQEIRQRHSKASFFGVYRRILWSKLMYRIFGCFF